MRTRRLGRILLEVFAGLLVLVIVIGVVGAWRLSQGPIRVDFLTPRVAEAAERLMEGTEVRTGPTWLAWEGWPETISLEIQDVEVHGPDGTLLVALPRVGAQISFGALFSGTVAPTQLTFYEPGIRFERQEDGSIVLDSALPEQPPLDLTRILPELLQDVIQSPDPRRPMTYLESLRIVDARAVMLDRRLGASWTMPWATAEVRAQPGGLSGEGKVDIQLGDNLLTADLGLSYDEHEGLVESELAITDLRPSWLGELIPGGDPLAGADIPLSGSLRGLFETSGRLIQLDFDMMAERGSLVLPERFPQPVTVDNLELRGGLNWPAGTLEVDYFDLLLDESLLPEDHHLAGTQPRITASALLEDLQSDPRLQAVARAESVPADTLWQLWPVGLARPAREWVIKNIREGIADSGEIEVDLRLPGEALEALTGQPGRQGSDDADREQEIPDAEIALLAGRIDYRGVEVQYLDELPPVREVEGYILFDQETFRMYPQSGVMGAATAGNAELVISGLDTRHQSIAMTIPVSGPLREAIEVIDSPGLDFARHLALRPGMVEGWAEGSLHFAFPLLADLTFDDVEALIEARLTDVVVLDLAHDLDVRNGSFDLRVTEDHLVLRGPIEVETIPVEIDWTERFDETTQPRRGGRVDISRLEVARLEELGLPLGPYAEGWTSGRLDIATYNGGRILVDGDFDLTPLGLEVALLGLDKQPQTPGRLNVTLEGEDFGEEGLSDEGEGGSLRVTDLDLLVGTRENPDFRLRGAADLGAGGEEFEAFEIAELRSGASRLGPARVRREAIPGEEQALWHIELEGEELDLEPILPVIRAQDEGEAEQPTRFALSIDAYNLNRVRFEEGRWFEDVSLHAERDEEGRWWRIDLDAGIPAELSSQEAPQNRQVTLRYGPQDNSHDGLMRLDFSTQDAGGALRAMGATHGIRGGLLEVRGQARPDDPQGPIYARIDGADMVALDAPILAQILTLGSLTGLSDTLAGEGIRFSRVQGDLRIDGSHLWSDLIRIYGPALGLTIRGGAEVGGAVDLEGTVAPMYSINQALGSIPLLGPLLTGGEGEGVFALTYRVRGPLEDPQVTVNPLSALAPGFLRTVFGAFGDSPSEPGDVDGNGSALPPETQRQVQPPHHGEPPDPHAMPQRDTDDPTRQR